MKDRTNNFNSFSKRLLNGRLILDVKELAKSQIKLPNYDLNDMISHFYPNDIPEDDHL